MRLFLESPCIYNMELNDLRKIIFWENRKFTFKTVTVHNVIEKLVEHGIQFVVLLYK